MNPHTIEIECLNKNCGYKFETLATSWKGLSLFAARCPRCGLMHTDEDVEAVQRVAIPARQSAQQLAFALA